MKRWHLVALVALPALLAVGAVVAFGRGKGGGGKVEEPTNDQHFDPRTPDALPAPPPADPLIAAAADAGMTARDYRDWHVRVDPEACPHAAEMVNKLEGRQPKDMKAQWTISACLQHGNMAWLRCLVDARSAEEGRACGKRFLRDPE